MQPKARECTLLGNFSELGCIFGCSLRSGRLSCQISLGNSSGKTAERKKSNLAKATYRRWPTNLHRAKALRTLSSLLPSWSTNFHASESKLLHVELSDGSSPLLLAVTLWRQSKDILFVRLPTWRELLHFCPMEFARKSDCQTSCRSLDSLWRSSRKILATRAGHEDSAVDRSFLFSCTNRSADNKTAGWRGIQNEDREKGRFDLREEIAGTFSDVRSLQPTLFAPSDVPSEL